MKLYNGDCNSEDDEFAVPETQESPATFSKNIIRRLGIRRTSSGTDAADPNSNTGVGYHCYYTRLSPKSSANNNNIL